MRTRNKEKKTECPFWITDIDDFFGIISDEERKSLYWCYEQQPNYSVFHAPYYIPIYIIHGVSLMRFKCDFGEWFVLAKHSENGCLAELSMVDKVLNILESDKSRIEEMQRIEKQTAFQRNAAHEMALAAWEKWLRDTGDTEPLAPEDFEAEINDFENIKEIIKFYEHSNLVKEVTISKKINCADVHGHCTYLAFFGALDEPDRVEEFTEKEIRYLIKAGFLVTDKNGVLWDCQPYVVGKNKCSHEGIKECKE